MIQRHLPGPIMHAVVECGGTIYVGGIVAKDVGLGMKGQTASALEGLEARLAQVGSDRTHVLSATVYITDFALKSEMNESWVAFFGSHLPARATLGVADLGPGVLIEIVAIAAH